MGVSQGNVVMIFLLNSIYYSIAFWGVLHAGAIVTTMNPLSSVMEIKKQVDDLKVCRVFTGLEYVSKLYALGVIVPENAVLDSKNDEQDTTVIMYSSGTAVASKGVMITRRNFIAALELFVQFEALQ
ncbi:hypothetical protein EV1_008865 [Malus domestica]